LITSSFSFTLFFEIAFIFKQIIKTIKQIVHRCPGRKIEFYFCYVHIFYRIMKHNIGYGPVPSQGHYGFHSFPLLTDFVCLYNYEFWLSLCKIVRSSVILLLPLFILSFVDRNSEVYLGCRHILLWICLEKNPNPISLIWKLFYIYDKIYTNVLMLTCQWNDGKTMKLARLWTLAVDCSWFDAFNSTGMIYL
jgi:hypothetical protein